jgi:hypothetical protein
VRPELIIVPTLFVTIAYIVWVLVDAAQRKQRMKLITEFQSRLLDKLGSVENFGAFLQTEAGSRFMNDLASEPVSGPQDRILRAVQVGIVLVCLGFGLLLLTFFSPTLPQRGHETFNALGIIALSLGIGFTISAAASYRLSGALGLLGRQGSGSMSRATSRG